MTTMEFAITLAEGRRPQFLRRLSDFISIPTISTLPESKGPMKRGAQWLADTLQGLDMKNVETICTPGHPAVYGEFTVSADRPTLLVYGHYDVQPPDPLPEWHSPPFEPTVRGEDLYGRGTADMKGSLVAFLEAVECLQAQTALPCNLKFLFEGEEEAGSENLPGLLKGLREKLQCDAVLNCDGGIFSAQKPSITYGLRGLAYFEVEVLGPRQDLHSGLFGGSIHNPAQVLCELIAGMHDETGRVTLPGFYDSVRSLDDEERDALARMPHSDRDWLEMSGAPALWGEADYTTVERVGARPTLDVNGLVSGFTGSGAKTVLPARAVAKISMRLVADQDPAAIQGQLEEYMRRHAPKTVKWEVRRLSCGPGATMDRNSEPMRAAVRALAETFGEAPFFRREGGSVPVVAMMQQELGVDSVMLGFCLPDSNIHGPNERQHLPTLYKGVETYIRFLTYLAG